MDKYKNMLLSDSRKWAAHWKGLSLAQKAYGLIFVALCIALVAPLWIITYLPLGDLPDHGALLRVMLHPNEYTDHKVNWFTPYIVPYGMALVFSWLVGIPAGIKIVLSLSMLSIPIASYYFIKVTEGDKKLVWITFPAAISFSLYWGFFSYIVASAVAMWLFVFALHYAKSTFQWRNYLIAALLSLTLFFSHALAWAFAMAACGLLVLIYNRLLDSIEKSSAFFIVLPVAMYWTSHTDMSGAGLGTVTPEQIKPGFLIGHYYLKAKQEFDYIIYAFNDRTARNIHWAVLKDLFSLAIGKASMPDFIAMSAYLMIWPALCGSKLRNQVRYWLPLILVVSAVMVIPYSILNAYYVNSRFIVFLLPFLLLCFRAPTAEEVQNRSSKAKIRYKVLYCSGLILILACIKGFWGELLSFRENDKAFAHILEKMQPNKRVLMLTFNHDSLFTISSPYIHFGSWYQAEKGGVALPNFAVDKAAYSVPVRFIGEEQKFPSPWNSAEFNWVTHNGSSYDYFLVRAAEAKDFLFSASEGAIVLLAQEKYWYLYGKKPANN